MRAGKVIGSHFHTLDPIPLPIRIDPPFIMTNLRIEYDEKNFEFDDRISGSIVLCLSANRKSGDKRFSCSDEVKSHPGDESIGYYEDNRAIDELDFMRSG